MVEPEKEIYVVTVLRICESKYKTEFLMLLGMTKLALMVFGVFLAWKTRYVHIDELNDSKDKFNFAFPNSN